jgi:hypothetical protein
MLSEVIAFLEVQPIEIPSEAGDEGIRRIAAEAEELMLNSPEPVELRYTPNDESTLGNVMRRQSKTQADFTYSILGNVISIIDLDPGEPVGYE